MVKQKFQRYDLVRIAKRMPREMAHFPADQDAIILGSYEDLYWPNGDTPCYAVFLKGSGHCSWYEESQLTHISSNERGIYETWKAELKRKEAR